MRPCCHPSETAFITFRLHSTILVAIAREPKLVLATAHAAVLDRMPIGQRYFDSEKMAEVLANEIMMLEKTGFVVHGFAILPNYAHLVLHLPASSLLFFAPAIDLLH